MKFFYVYKITNLINGRIYIGARQSSVIPEEDPYMGSGIILAKAKKKYGLENFKKEILKICNSKEEMYKEEAKLVNKDFIKDKSKVYNIRLGGDGGGVPGTVNVKDSAGNQFRVSVTDARYLTKEVISVNKGKSSYKNIETGEVKFLSCDSEEVKSKKGKCVGFFKKDPNKPAGGLGKHHTEKTKKKIAVANSKKQAGSNNSNYAHKGIFNDKLKENKSIKMSEVQMYLDIGGKIGRKIEYNHGYIKHIINAIDNDGNLYKVYKDDKRIALKELHYIKPCTLKKRLIKIWSKLEQIYPNLFII